MIFNSRVDMGSYPFIDTSYFNERLEGRYDQIYITFVAIEGDNKEDVWEDQGDWFIRIPLPYQQACSFKALDVMKEKLIDKLLELDDMDLVMYVASAICLEDAAR